MNKFRLIIFSLLACGSLLAQDLSKLTPEQMDMYKKYMAGKSITSTGSTTAEVKDVVENRTIDSNVAELTVPAIDSNSKKLSVFGSYLFDSQNLTFEPKLNIPTPPNYLLGTYDELIVDISGMYEANYKIKVSPEGFIRLPNVGPIKVSGLTITAATKSIKSQLAPVFPGINSGETKLNVTLGNIRSIRVTVVGEAERPGTYTLPSLATAFNALYVCGGPNATGTMRDIKVVRSGKIIAHLDVYRFLIDGILLNNVGLQDEDIILIDPYKIKASITGAVKHIGIFEGIQGETIQNLLQYAGGFTENAFKDKITVFRFTRKEKTIVIVDQKEYENAELVSGDSLVVGKTLNRFDNKIEISGSVLRPGSYALEPELTVKQLIEKAGGIKEDAFMKIAFISRIQENRTPQNISFNLGKLLNDNYKDILLQKDDKVQIRSIFDFLEKKRVNIIGPVQHPGTYTLVENTSLKDLLFLAGGFIKTAATDTIELVRIIKDPKILRFSNKKSTVRKFALDKDQNVLNGGDSVLLENDDQVIVRTISGYEPIRMVRIDGEIIHPGSYNITNKAERISDILKRAGGCSQYAYNEGAFLIRTENVNEIQKKLNKMMISNSKNQLEDNKDNTLDVSLLKSMGANNLEGYLEMDSLQKKMSGSQVLENVFNTEGIVGLNLNEIMKRPGGKYDFFLENNDVLYIPRKLQTVRVFGQVLFPTIVRFDKSMKMRDYIGSSGGFSTNASRTKLFVLYANGNAKSTKNFLFFKFYPKIEPGSRIIVPEKPIEIKNKLTAAETIAIFTSITSSTALIYSIIKK